jgi:Flp pilus assembly protein TadG
MPAGLNFSKYLRHLREIFRAADATSSNTSEQHSESGAALVEFTILMPVFFLILFGIIEFGSIIWLQSAMNTAAREGARAAAVQGGTMTTATQKACNRLGVSSGGQQFQITATDTLINGGTPSAYCEVKVDVNVSKASASLLNAFFGYANGGLTGSQWSGQVGSSATMRREDTCTAAQAAVGPCTCTNGSGC